MEEHLVNSATSINELPTAVDSHLGNPYLNARKEWDERYGSLIKRAQHWRGAAVLALLVALAEAVVILGVATRPKTVPRSEERRVGKECRVRSARHNEKEVTDAEGT